MERIANRALSIRLRQQSDICEYPRRNVCCIQKPIPASITQLQGVGDTWQGYQLFLRFQAAEANIQSLLQSGYKSVDCDAIASNFRLPDPSYDRFDPPWQPQVSSKNECWTANPVSNSWTGFGTHYLLIDRQNNQIYFTGTGA